MSSSPDNFESLEKLLKLKRHEQPPPRYFNEFSGRVVARIDHGDARLSWWERFGFDLRPALAAGAGIVACGLIVYGVATTDGDAASFAGGFPAPGSDIAAMPQPSALAADSEKSVKANSTNPVPGNYSTPVDRKVFGRGVVPVSFRGQ